MKKTLYILFLSVILAGTAFYTGCAAPSGSVSESLETTTAALESIASEPDKPEAAPVSKP